jgi:replicative DNA helicase
MKMVRDVVDENKRLNSSVEEYGKMIMKIDDSVKQEVAEMVRRVQRVE